ncbi:N-acetylmuramoyl-L-alanine amidase [Peptoniphilus sp.]|uniref:N-acetylmuramoyl-L-alanine amidase n=1 Tax=Peptoniphilus sp. TaxID=1971214 RepID=UPI0039925D69
MRKLFFLVLLMILIVPTYALNSVKIDKKDIKVLDANVLVNGSPIQSDFTPYVTKGRTFVPVRELTEGLGAEVNWDGENMTVEIKFGEKTILLKINSDVTYVDGKKKIVEEDQVPKLALYSSPRVETKTMIPLRFVSETLGYNVSWDEKTSTVLIATGENISSEVVKTATIISDDDLKEEDNKNKNSSVEFQSSTEKKETKNAQKNNKSKIFEKAGLTEDEYKIDPKSRKVSKGFVQKGERIKIVLDAGHGGTDSGAISTIDKTVTEKALNLDMIERLNERFLMLGYDVILTRSEDEYIKLLDRARISNTSDADIFLSIHFNSTTNSTSKGIEVLYASEKNVIIKSVEQVHLAKAIQKELIESTGSTNRGVKNRADLIVLNKTKNVAALCELGFLTNREDMENITSSSYLDTMADAIVRGVENYVMNYRMDIDER